MRKPKILFTFDSNYVPPINMLMFYGQVVYVPCKNVSGQYNEKTGCDFYVSIFFFSCIEVVAIHNTVYMQNI